MATCPRAVIFGSVTTKFAGSRLPFSASSRSRNRPAVRSARSRSSSPRFLIRIPMNGGACRASPPRQPRPPRTRRGRPPRRRADCRSRPRSRARKSSTGSRASFSRTRACTRAAAVGGDAERRGERVRVRGVLVHHAESRRPEPRRRVCLEQVRAAVDRVDRLASMSGAVHSKKPTPLRAAGGRIQSPRGASSDRPIGQAQGRPREGHGPGSVRRRPRACRDAARRHGPQPGPARTDRRHPVRSGHPLGRVCRRHRRRHTGRQPREADRRRSAVPRVRSWSITRKSPSC